MSNTYKKKLMKQVLFKERRKKHKNTMYRIDSTLNDYMVNFTTANKATDWIHFNDPYASSYCSEDRELIESAPPQYFEIPPHLYLMAQEAAKEARLLFRMPTVINHFRMTFDCKRYPSEVKRITNEIEKVIKRYFEPIHRDNTKKIQVDPSHFDICWYGKQVKRLMLRTTSRPPSLPIDGMIIMAGIICISSQITGYIAGAMEVYAVYERHVFPQSTQPGMMLLFPARLIHDSYEIKEEGDWKETLEFNVYVPETHPQEENFILRPEYFYPSREDSSRYPCRDHSTALVPTTAEYRIDPMDGNPYTLQQFMKEYSENALHHWETAAPVLDEYRIDPMDGNPYTLQQFLKAYSKIVPDPYQRWWSAIPLGGCVECRAYELSQKRGIAFSKPHLKELRFMAENLLRKCECMNCDMNSEYNEAKRLHCILWGKHRRLPSNVVKIIGEFKRFGLKKCSCPHRYTRCHYKDPDCICCQCTTCVCACTYCSRIIVIWNNFIRCNLGYDDQHPGSVNGHGR